MGTLFFPHKPGSSRDMKHAIRMRSLAHANVGHSHFPHKFLELVQISKWRFSCSLNGHIQVSPNTLIVGPRLVITPNDMPLKDGCPK